ATLLAERAQMIADAHPTMAGIPIPYDLVTVSGSGMDPDITVPAAEYQIDRIAASRGIDKMIVADAIKKNTTGKFLGLFGNAYVNVLLVNLTLDGIIS
ncbi:MAG: potassium-transporting ATPase subunit C, partial [Firmicutes bacterium]|nr:potassium-transporting ATPase subunit C [Bacillota bacterium]